jgi:ABC-type polysaccharide/polyol phosphate transport system ATPase subunit
LLFCWSATGSSRSWKPGSRRAFESADMTDIALRMDRIYKKFTKGERHDSLRDLIPALATYAIRRVARPIELRKQEFWALQDISFEIAKGEAVGIIGHNGAGKSTMLKLLCGILRPASGKVHVAGRLSALIELGAGFHQDLTGRENVFLNGVILGMSKAEIRRKFDEIVEFSGISEFIDTPVKRYSSGMYARLGFSVAAHMEPDILVIDEVLSVGDWVFQTKSAEKIRSVLNSGATVIFVSHNLRAVADLCGRSLLLKRGRLIEDGATSQVIQTYMEQAKTDRLQGDDKDVIIEAVSVHGLEGPRLDFQAGAKAWINVQLRALKRVEKLACVLYLVDDRHYNIFDTSTERLGLPPMTLEAGDTRTCSFELDLHLAAGNFHVCSSLYRYDVGHVYDRIEPATTLLIRSPIDVRGAANLYPRVTLKETLMVARGNE